MKVIKRDGREVDFDRNKIISAIAYNVVDPLVRNFMNICGVQILTKCPFCKSVNKITLKDRSPVSTPCDN